MDTREQLDNKPKVYEIGYLLAPTIAEEQLAGKVQDMKNLIEKHQGAFITEDFPKLRPLAYTMSKVVSGSRRKFDTAYFGWIKFETMASHISQIKAELDKNEDFIRFMIINTVRENTMASQRIIFKPPESEKAKKGDAAEGPKMTEEEIDKTIENLVVE